ncbi:MAG: hypothetical protein MJ211_05900 [Bacteroidales bacterium]|nr:hypothetical protein [Bacteroidales bacterium]
MSMFLYGAAVQGIQDFIFQTNELKDIVGASELVEEICTEYFKEFEVANGNAIVKAAGNIKYIFLRKEDCEKAVLNFPKKVMVKAPGITVSQAVVEVEDDTAKDWFKKAVDDLEQKLKVQRNRPSQNLTLGFLGTKRSPKTGRPVWGDGKEKNGKGELLDEAVTKMREAFDDAKDRLVRSSFGLSSEELKGKITDKIDKFAKFNDWIAVIHADGNGLGNIIRTIGDDDATLSKFSEGLNDATERSAQKAFDSIKCRFTDYGKIDIIPIRPIVVGGDDFTVICRADFALDYVTEYLKQFENNTETFIKELKKDNEKLRNSGIDKLTACAGIAYIKSSFPFHYGYHLAEKLCDYAKSVSRKNSCLMFHKVQDSFVEDFKSIINRELTIPENESFVFGPYFAKEVEAGKENEYWTVCKLTTIKDKLSDEEGNKVKSAIRQFIGLLKAGDGRNFSKLRRIIAIVKQSNDKLEDVVKEITKGERRKNADGKEVHYYPAYDILSLLSVENQVTKK